MDERKAALGLVRKVGFEIGQDKATIPAAREAKDDRERRLVGLGYLIALQDTEETANWTGMDAEIALCDVEDDAIWADAEEAWLDGFVAGIRGDADATGDVV